MSYFQKFQKHPYYTAVAVIVVIGGFWYWYSHRATTAVTQYVTAVADKQTIISSVNGTGQVSTLKRLDIKPQTSGTTNQSTVTKMNVTVGQVVKAGQMIAKLDDTNALVALEQAQASLISAQANYNKVVNGATQTDLNKAEQDVLSAQSALANAQTNYDTVVQQQNTAVANSYRTLLTSGIAAVKAEWPYTSSGVTGADAPVITGSYSNTASGTYHIYQQGSYYSVSGIEDIPTQKFDTSIPSALGSNGLYIKFPNDQISAEWDIALPNPQGTSYVYNLSSYQSALLGQKQAVSSAQNQVTNAQTNLQKVQDALNELKQPADESSAASAKAQLINAQSNLRNAQNNYNNTRITAPFDGEIAAVNSQVGDQVSGSTVVATLITQQKIAEISLNEVDAAKVMVGDQVTLTFDAIPDLTITGKVSQINLLGTVTQGVVNYDVQIAFDTQDQRVRPDMSVTASIITDTKTDVIAVPNSAIKTVGNTSFVQIVDSNNIASQNGTSITLKSDPRQQAVQTGVSNDSYTEITSGLSGGESVIVRTISSSKTTTSGTGSGGGVRIPGLGGGGGRGF